VHVTIVEIQVKPEFVEPFLEACRLNHQASIQEAGNRRFDVLQSADDPTRFVLYEAYRSEADAKAHKETEHYRQWRDTVADWMAEPRQGRPFIGHWPE
jgi:autoinducer 2-degrading protein